MPNYRITNVSKDSSTRTLRREAIGTVKTTFRLPALRLLPGKSVTLPGFIFDQYRDLLGREAGRGVIEVWELHSNNTPLRKVDFKKVPAWLEVPIKEAPVEEAPEAPISAEISGTLEVESTTVEVASEPEPTPAPDFSLLTRKELEEILANKGLSFKKTDTKGDLLAKLGA